MIVTVISSVLVAFGFARFNLPGKRFLFALLIATVLLPKSVLLIPQYLMFREFGWLDTFLPLYVPSAFATEGLLRVHDRAVHARLPARTWRKRPSWTAATACRC